MKNVPYSNLHCHTIFSDGVNTPEEMIQAAIECGMVTIGFSEHSTTPGQMRYCMRPSAVEAYKREVTRLKAKYAGQIEVVLGLELDARSEIRDRADYDYVIGDIHDIAVPGGFSSVDGSAEEQRRCMEEHCGGDAIEYACRYYDAYVESIRRMRPDILGHFDLLTKFGLFDERDPLYRAIAADALHKCMEVCSIVEMNTGAISRGYRKLPYPADFLLREIRDCGGEIILSSDTHAADTQTCFFEESLEILRKVGFDHITLWRGGSFDKTEI